MRKCNILRFDESLFLCGGRIFGCDIDFNAGDGEYGIRRGLYRYTGAAEQDNKKKKMKNFAHNLKKPAIRVKILYKFACYITICRAEFKMKQHISAYKAAGVDIDAGNSLVERIKPLVKRTNRSGVAGGIGGFGALFDLKETGYKDPVLVSATDGVGTKLRIAIESGIHDTVGIDLVAMCVNDLVVQGAEPLFFLDYFASGRLDIDVAEAVISGIADGCEEAGCALIGGETAEMPGMYGEGDYDLAGFCVGAVERSQILTGQGVAEGDVIMGIASSGLHSNGFSLVRKIIADNGLDYRTLPPFESDKNTLGEAFLIPTRIYVRPLLALLKEGIGMKGFAHITGGGLLENIPRIMPEGLVAVLDAKNWPLPPVFSWLAEKGKLSADDMARTLNCGIGMAVICAEKDTEAVKSGLEEQGESVFAIGQVVKEKDRMADRVVIEGADQWRPDL